MAIEMVGITKRFADVLANDGISVTFAAGTITGLLGENGAGKTTLMRILSGFLRLDSGWIVLNGQELRFESPAEALRFGIGMLHQDPLDFPQGTVLDNFLIGRTGFRLNRAQAKQALQALADHFGFQLPTEARVSELTLGQRQQLELARLLSLGVETLILDEPTAVTITKSQKQVLFDFLGSLAREGRTIIFVSHRLPEVEELCQRVTILRQGKVVGGEVRPFDTERLLSLMFGKIPRPRPRPAIPVGDSILEIDGVVVREGEILGIAGLEGSGQDRFLRACASRMSRLGAYLPSGRLEEGLIAGMSLTEHTVLASRASTLFINWSGAYREAKDLISRFAILGQPQNLVEHLSGGNQQRAMLALLPQNIKLLALDYPTRGLDVESTIAVWELLLERCREGSSIIFTSTELDELLRFSDRVLVFFGGKMLGPFEAASISPTQLGQLIGGRNAIPKS